MEIRPSFSEFELMAEQGNLIPVYQEFLADVETPVSAYLKIRDKSFSYLLESADGGDRWGRYSFIGYKPYIVVLSRPGEIEIREGSEKRVLKDVKNPLSVLRDLCLRFKPLISKDLSRFQGGLVGYFNYDLIRMWESFPGISPEDPDLPECLFTASSRLIIFDHLSHKIKVVAFAHLLEGSDPRAVYAQACEEVSEAIDELQRPLSAVSDEEQFSLSELNSNFSKEEFGKAVKKAKDYIVAGDVIQVVLSQRFSGEVAGNGFALYRNLRSVNPSPYMFYLNFRETKLIGASPEILVRLTDGKIELRPIAGTRPRGETAEEDLALERELMADPKERAEHIMLVDLGRNDVGKVAVAGSVTVPRLMEVERYSHVMHIVSRVEGTLKPDMDSFDLFMSSFPAGTVSGAPKIRAMEIISELEPTQRGSYAGAVGYFAFNGNMDFCIVIRTIAIMKNRLSIQVGAGIVADSSPDGEFHETMRKGAAMFRAIEKMRE
ncbi:MAG: anthranilate synthase component I [Thermodesulfobacteriota bacterium]|nr:anthranilate synthase component I [Thermodesulfobacteriota bacterium]